MMRKKLCVALASAMFISVFSGCGRKAPEDSSGSNQSGTESASGNSNASSTDAKDDYVFDRDSKKVQEKEKTIDAYIDKYFYFDESGSKQEESYFDGIMNGLDDPYSCYYTKEEYERMKEDDAGSFSGIGATLQQETDTGFVVVVKTMKDNPAEKAGIKDDDKIVQVDDTELTTDMDLDTVVGMIRGKKGTNVHIKVYRESEKKYYEFDIVRDDIKISSVEYEVVEGNLGYISVSQFINTTSDDFKAAVDDLQSQGVKALVIDMRSNPGGFVKAATSMADYLIDDNSQAEGAKKSGLLLQTKDKNGKIEEEIVCSDGHSVDLPMVVLVNDMTASSSEIFTGIMKDYKKATIIGTKTYGKGIVQQIFPLEDGSAVKITIAKYFIPSGSDIHKVGIEPDKVVEYEPFASESDATKVDDTQEQAAFDELTK